MRGVQERFMENRRRFYQVFVDLEKAFDRGPWEMIRWANW